MNFSRFGQYAGDPTAHAIRERVFRQLDDIRARSTPVGGAARGNGSLGPGPSFAAVFNQPTHNFDAHEDAFDEAVDYEVEWRALSLQISPFSQEEQALSGEQASRRFNVSSSFPFDFFGYSLGNQGCIINWTASNTA